MFRSDAGVTHRLSLSGRLLYTASSRVKPKRHCKTPHEALLRLGESPCARTPMWVLVPAPSNSLRLALQYYYTYIGNQAPARALLGQRQCDSTEGADYDGHKWRCPPCHKQHETDQSDCKICRSFH